MRLRLLGGSGAEAAKVSLVNSPTATFGYNVARLGGGGANDVTFVGTNPVAGTPTFGPSGSILIDPGLGGDDRVDVFGNLPVKVVD